MFKKSLILDALLLMLTCTLLFFVYQHFPFSHLYSTMINNSDVLFIEDVARNLNNGGRLYDWRLTQAPYLFPDIFLARIIAFFTTTIGKVSIYYHAIYGMLIVGLVFWVTRLTKISSYVPVLLAAVLYLFSYFGMMNSDVISMYFGLIGHHSGVTLLILLAIVSTILHFRDNGANAFSLGMMFLAMFLGVISDSLVVLAFVPFMVVYLWLCVAKHEMTQKKAINFFGVMILAVILGKAFGYLTPFPQDRDFMRLVLSQFPSWTINAVKLFPVDFVKFFFKSYISAFLFIAYLFACFISFRHLKMVLNNIVPVKSPITLLSLFVVMSPMVVILLQLALGLYVSIDSSRQWAAMIYLSIVFGAIILVYHHETKLDFLRIFLIMMLVIMIVPLKISYAFHKGIIIHINAFSNFINCLRENHLPAGQWYVSDYWVARPVRLYSNGDYYPSPYGNLIPFTNASNVIETRKATPKYIITGYSVNYDEAIRRFGKPKAEYCQMIAGTSLMRVLDYSDNIKAKAYLRNNAINAY